MYFAASLMHDLIDYASHIGIDISELKVDLPGGIKKMKYVDYDIMVNLIHQMGGYLYDENLGMHVGEQISLRATVPVDNIMLNSQTLEDSIRNAIEYSKLISDALECSLEMSEQHFAVIYEENPNWKVQNDYARKQIMDLALYSNVKSLAAYTNHQYYPVRVNFSYKKPKKINEYYRLFNCSLMFNQNRTEIVYDRQIINRHTKEVRLGLLDNLKDKVADEISNLKPEDRLIYELKKCILNSKPRRIAISEAANLLNTSTRTLQRKLTQRNTSFKTIEHELQLKLSKTYLEERQKTVDEISYLLGFSESSAFIRFFKTMTSSTPKKYHNALKYLT